MMHTTCLIYHNMLILSLYNILHTLEGFRDLSFLPLTLEGLEDWPLLVAY